ncbi:hypothetical protein GCM10010401_08160 [Rarobacter faecitabidus]|uniref:Uncharacterized protein n=1 Tax=Rarobacter faecitabidus TaxID=13243 RepID=A0A542ZAR5_RARFA|nr:hypothetical protein FB461_2156 [Rarobacter faecitabidus]
MTANPHNIALEATAQEFVEAKSVSSPPYPQYPSSNPPIRCHVALESAKVSDQNRS